jgi:hypothetical protein
VLPVAAATCADYALVGALPLQAGGIRRHVALNVP